MPPCLLGVFVLLPLILSIIVTFILSKVTTCPILNNKKEGETTPPSHEKFKKSIFIIFFVHIIQIIFFGCLLQVGINPIYNGIHKTPIRVILEVQVLGSGLNLLC